MRVVTQGSFGAPGAPRTAPRAPPSRVRGRHWVALVLAGFLVVSLIVVRRQSAAVAAARQLADLERERGALEVQRAALLGAIQHGRSRSVMVPVGRRLGLRLPDDSEITILQEPVPR